MKATTLFCLLLLSFSQFCYSQKEDDLTACSVKMKSVNGLRMSKPVALVNVKEKMTGDLSVNGYQFAYAGTDRKVFVQVKAESTGNRAATLDSVAVFAYLQGLSVQADSSQNNIIRLSYNGYKIFGVVRNPATTNGIIESFVMLPGNNEILQFDFFTTKPSDAGFQSVEYMGARNSFFGDYTSQLRKCPNR